MNNMWILAQTDGTETSTVAAETINEEQETTTTAIAQDPNSGTRSRPKGPFGEYSNLIFIALIMLVFWMILFRGPKKKQQQHKKMLGSLAKNDRIRTIGGIFGTIVDIKDDEITLKVDEANNTKIKIASNAIGTKVSETQN